MASSFTTRPELARDLTVSHATAIVVGTIIGSGIFLVPAEMMQDVGTARMVYLVWIVGGVLSFFGAMTYAELGAMKPAAGGEYIYVRDGYGPLMGFLYAWTTFLISKPASIATITAGLVRILGTFGAFSGLVSPALTFPFTITWGTLLAISATLLISLLNYLGVKKAGEFQLIFTWLKVLMIFGIVFAGFTYAHGSWSNFATEFVGAKGGFAGFMAALVAALWAYDGWNNLNMLAGEIRKPERNLPIALVAGVGACALLYMLVNAAVQYVLPAAAVAAAQRPASDALTLTWGAAGAAFVSAGIALSMIVTLNGTILSGARVPFAAARDGYFFRAAAEIHPRFHTPSVSIGIQALLATLLLLGGGSFKAFFSLAIFSEWLFYMITASTVFIFRKKIDAALRPYKMWGYPAVPALFVAASAVLLYYTFTDNLAYSSIGVAVILAGVPVFYGFKKTYRSA